MVRIRGLNRQVRIGPNTCGYVTSGDIERLAEITMVYFPDYEEACGIVNHHIQNADSLRIARDRNGVIVGFSIASCFRRSTPFYPQPLNVVYQRMLYLAPDVLYRGLGKRLLVATFRDLMGPLWPFRHFAVVCRTLNPVVARMMDMHTVSYPHYGEQIPDDVRAFAGTLLPMLGARSMDEKFRLVGTLDKFQGVDYTEIWNRHLHRQINGYERLMLDSAFTEENGKIINNGVLVFMAAYSKPLQLISYLFH